MSALLTRFQRDERGIGVISAVIVGFVLFTSSATWLSISMQQNQRSAQERDRERAFATAEAAVTEAMNLMSFAPQECPGLDGVPIATGSLDGGGDYEFYFVAPDPSFACSDDTTLDRYIVARAWAPSKDAPRPQRRQVEQQIRLKPTDGFKYALFAAPGGIQSGNNMTVNGDVYSDHDLVIGQQSKIFGNATGQQLVSIDNNSTVSGEVWARGNVSLLAAGSLVQGDSKTSGGDKLDVDGNVVMADAYAGDIYNRGTIEQKAIFAGTYDDGGKGKAGATVKTNSDPPPRRKLPDFDPAKPTYDNTYLTDGDFETMWGATRTDFTGAYRITPGVGQIDLDKKTAVRSGSTALVVADGPIALGADVEATASEVSTLVLVSMAVSTETDATPSILLSQQQKFPSNINVVLFAPNGCVEFQNLKQFTGVVYAKCLKVGNNFTLTYREPPKLDGFTWTAASASHFKIEAQVFREVRFQP